VQRKHLANTVRRILNIAFRRDDAMDGIADHEH